MNILIIILLAVAAYLIGSFSSALWYGKWFYGIDIREHGSKNAGSTNVLRVLGWKCAIPVFITDVIKSFVPTMFFVMILNHFASTGCETFVEKGSEAYYLYQLLFGMMAIVGHIFPIFSGFKGGKGVASMLGLVLALDPLSIVVCILGFFREAGHSITMTVFSVLVAVLLIVTHRKNIKRLLNHEEPKITIGKKE